MFREYAAWIGDEFWVRDFEGELAALPGYYRVLLVARDNAGALVGSAAVKHLPDDGAAELKGSTSGVPRAAPVSGNSSPSRRSTAPANSATA